MTIPNHSSKSTEAPQPGVLSGPRHVWPAADRPSAYDGQTVAETLFGLEARLRTLEARLLSEAGSPASSSQPSPTGIVSADWTFGRDGMNDTVTLEIHAPRGGDLDRPFAFEARLKGTTPDGLNVVSVRMSLPPEQRGRIGDTSYEDERRALVALAQSLLSAVQ